MGKMSEEKYYVMEDGVRREATDLEKADIEQRRLISDNEIASMNGIATAKESAKAKLAALGLTEAEVNAIIGGV